jgi:hypothetical protein
LQGCATRTGNTGNECPCDFSLHNGYIFDV